MIKTFGLGFLLALVPACSDAFAPPEVGDLNWCLISDGVDFKRGFSKEVSGVTSDMSGFAAKFTAEVQAVATQVDSPCFRGTGAGASLIDTNGEEWELFFQFVDSKDRPISPTISWPTESQIQVAATYRPGEWVADDLSISVIDNAQEPVLILRSGSITAEIVNDHNVNGLTVKHGHVQEHWDNAVSDGHTSKIKFVGDTSVELSIDQTGQFSLRHNKFSARNIANISNDAHNCNDCGTYRTTWAIWRID